MCNKILNRFDFHEAEDNLSLAIFLDTCAKTIHTVPHIVGKIQLPTPQLFILE